MSEGDQTEDNAAPVVPISNVPEVPPVAETVEVDAPAPANPDRERETDDGFKAVCRDHIRWMMIEMQLATEGKTLEEREALNP